MEVEVKLTEKPSRRRDFVERNLLSKLPAKKHPEIVTEGIRILFPLWDAK